MGGRAEEAFKQGGERQGRVGMVSTTLSTPPAPCVFQAPAEAVYLRAVSASRRGPAGAARVVSIQLLPDSSSAVSLSSRQWVTETVVSTLVISSSSEIVSRDRDLGLGGIFCCC